MNTLLVSTRNAHKLAEIKELLADTTLNITSLNEVPSPPEVIEDGATFEENAIKKAVVMAERFGLPTLADDSGLEVDALDGAPGIHSARYAGVHGDDEANNAKLLEALLEQSQRNARFVCALALSQPDGTTKTLRGVCEGHIAFSSSGSGGFGYDPIFIPEGYTQSFADLGQDIKQKISHRARALRQAKKEWFS